MARILSFDYGVKRVGIAATDPLQIIATPLETIATPLIFDFLKEYLQKEEVEAFLVGEPLQLDGEDARIMPLVRAFAARLHELFPAIPVFWQDERFSSFEAKRSILSDGTPKMKRRDKGRIDQVSAAIILQQFMEARRNR